MSYKALSEMSNAELAKELDVSEYMAGLIKKGDASVRLEDWKKALKHMDKCPCCERAFARNH